MWQMRWDALIGREYSFQSKVTAFHFVSHPSAMYFVVYTIFFLIFWVKGIEKTAKGESALEVETIVIVVESWKTCQGENDPGSHRFTRLKNPPTF